MGGAAGHMKHPFDLPAVETGEDLKQFFETAADWVIENTAALKIDGVNASFKLIDSPNTPNGKEFALDRGSAKPIDVEGITTSRVGERWPEEHGMYSATKILLDIFNKALWHEEGLHIKEELEQLGVWDDPTVIFNTEFVLKNLNVKEYKTNFIALHGINKFSWATKKRRASKEVSYDKDSLESLRDKVAPFAKIAKDLQGDNLDMEVYTSVPVAPLKGDDGAPARADFSNTLNTVFPIHQRYGEPPIERSLGNWLAGADNPRGAKISLITGRKVGALSKEIYKVVLNTTEPLADLLGEDEESIKLARDGAIFYHATRLLGNDVLSTLTAGEDFGPVNEEEGIVLRDKIAFGTDDPVKITGNFILGGEAGKLAQKARAAIAQSEEAGNIVALFPGGFKPPHAGHFELAKRYAEDPQVSKVLMLVGPATRRSKNSAIAITKESSVHIISQFYKQYLGDKVILEDSPGGEENPMRAAFRWIDETAQPGETYTLAASSKDPKRAEQFAASHQCPDGKYCKEGVDVILHPVDIQAVVYSGRTDDLNGKPISASVMREDLANGDKRNFMTNLPAAASDYVDEIFDFLGGQVKKTPETIESPTSQSSSDELINKVMSEIIRKIGIKKGKKQVQSFKHIKEGNLAEDDLGEDQLFKKKGKGKKKKGKPYGKEDIIEPKKEKKPLKKKKSKKQTLVGDEYDFEEYKRWKEEELEEISTVSGGDVQGPAGAFVDFTEEENQKEAAATRLRRENKTIYDKKGKNMQNEQLLRESIRKLIKKKYNLFEKQKSEENKLRTVIQEIIKESTKVSDSPTKSTGINKLIGVLKIILPTVETGFKGLTTSSEQRESYKQHLVKAFVDTLSPVDVINKVGDPDHNPEVAEEAEMPEAPLAEQAGDAVDVDFKGINVDRKPEEDPFETEEDKAGKEEEAAAEEEEEKRFDAEAIEGPEGEKKPFPEIAGLDPTGRDEAVDIYKKTKDAILRTYKRLHNQGDRDHFQDYLITNLLLYFDKWESDIGLAPEDTVTTPEYEAAKQEKTKYASDGAEGAALEEAVKRAVQNTILKST